MEKSEMLQSLRMFLADIGSLPEDALKEWGYFFAVGPVDGFAQMALGGALGWKVIEALKLLKDEEE